MKNNNLVEQLDVRKFFAAIRELPHNVWAVTLTSFLNDISSEMVFNLLPLFLVNVLGAGVNVVGLIEGIAETTASLLKMYFGWLSDRLGQRKPLALAGYSLSAFVKPLLFLANSWGAVLFLRFADRVGKGIRTAPRDALIADSASVKHRGLAFGIQRAGDTAGAAIGLIIALLTIWLVQGNSLSLGRTTFQTVVLVSAIPAFLAVLVLGFGARDTLVKNKVQTSTSKPALADLGSGFGIFISAVILFTLGNSSDAFIILRAQERGLSLVGIMTMLITFNIIYALVSGPIGALSDRVSRRKLLIIAWLGYALIYFGFAYSTQIWHVWILYAFYGVYYGATEGVSKAIVADLVVPKVRGSAYGVYNAAIGLAALPASLFAGILWQGLGDWQGFGPSAPFLFGASMALIATVILISSRRYMDQGSKAG